MQEDKEVLGAQSSMSWQQVVARIGLARVLFLAAAGLSFLLSVSLFFTGDHERGIFVGIWVPSILSAGALLLGGSDDD